MASALLPALLAFVVPLAPPPLLDETDEEVGPTAEEIRAAVREVRDALWSDEVSVRVEVLTRQRLAAPEVIELVAKGLDDKEQDVRQAALESLRWTEHEEALEVLHRTSRRKKKLRKHETLGPLLFKAIGQHGRLESLELLEDKLFLDENEDSVRTRILAMGRIRDPESIEVLLDLATTNRADIVRRYRYPLRVSLMKLTGIDRGIHFDRWKDWWDENEKTFEMADRPPRLQRDDQRRWEDFWGLENSNQRNERREDRGSGEG